MLRIAPPIALAFALAIVAAPIASSAIIAQAAPSAPAAEGDITWSVEPIQTPDGVRRSFEYTVDPGTQIVDSMVITNSGETSAEFLIYATDAINELETGAFGLLEREAEPTDAGAWITMASDALTIEPGTQAIVPFNLLVPSDATPGEHVAGVIAAVITAGSSDGAAVELEQRVGARVYLTVSGAIEAGVEIEGLTSGFNPEFNPFAPGNVDLSYTLRNSGNLRVDVAQTITVNGPFGIQIAQLTPEPVTELLPRQSVRVDSNIPAVLALFLSFSTVTVTPGAVGTGGAQPDAEGDPAVETPAAQSTPSADGSVTDESVVDESVVDESVVDQSVVDYVPVSETSFAFAISWTLLVLVLIVVALIYFVWRYVSGTRERLYLAIDEAAAAARSEASSDSKQKVGV